MRGRFDRLLVIELDSWKYWEAGAYLGVSGKSVGDLRRLLNEIDGLPRHREKKESSVPVSPARGGNEDAIRRNETGIREDARRDGIPRLGQRRGHEHPHQGPWRPLLRLSDFGRCHDLHWSFAQKGERRHRAKAGASRVKDGWSDLPSLRVRILYNVIIIQYY